MSELAAGRGGIGDSRKTYKSTFAWVVMSVRVMV